MSAPAVPASLARIPNALTAGRLVLVPIFAVAIGLSRGGHSWAAAVLFGVAGATDQIDGFLARRWRVESEFGRIADPLADRLIIAAAVILLYVKGRLPWLALAIPARDVLLVGGFSLVKSTGYDFSVSLLGKAATWLLYAALFCVMATTRAAGWPLVLLWVGLALAAGAGVSYVADAWKALRRR